MWIICKNLFGRIFLNNLSFDDREGYIWYNGDLLEWKNANVHVLNHGLHYASCVFEGERAYRGKIFETIKHTERLFNSAKALDMQIPFSKKNERNRCQIGNNNSTF